MPSYLPFLLILLVGVAGLPVLNPAGSGMFGPVFPNDTIPPANGSSLGAGATSLLPIQQDTQNITVTVAAQPNLTAQINTAKLSPWEAATPDGIRNASRMIIVRTESIMSPPPENKSQQLKLAATSITGWIMDSDYNYYYPFYPFTGSLTFMSAQWIVPPAPSSTGGLVYWFPGLQSNSHIIQPVLQYGAGPEGGGNYWVLANWWAGCASCSYMVTTPVQVNPGDLVYGSVSWSGSAWTIHARDLSTNTGPLDLNVADTDQYYNSVVTLEGYAISSCSQLSGGVSFESITLRAGSTTVTPSWTKNGLSNIADQGQCGIDSNDVILKSSSQVIINTADPQISWYSLSSTSINLGSYFDITLTVVNQAGSDSQTAHISFPSSTSSVQISGTDMSAKVYPAGSNVNGCYGSCTVITGYPFAEGSASFNTGQTHYVTVRAYPSQVGVFTVYFKTVALVNGVNARYASDWAPTSGTIDQQSEYVYPISLTVLNPLPTLSVSLVSPPSPANGVTVTSSPVTLEAQVTSGGSAVSGATVPIWVDGSNLCSGSSDSNGEYSCSYSPSQGGHAWYAAASKAGYNPNTSPTWSFTYSPTYSAITIANNPSVYEVNVGGVSVDGVEYPTPVTFTWAWGSTHTLTAPSRIILGEGHQYVFVSWSDGGAQSHTITTPPTSTTYTATFKEQYYLTVSSTYDSPTPTSNWYDAGSSISASVNSPVSGGTGTQYVCTGWTGSGSVPATGSICSTSFTINAASSITWNWKTQYQLAMQVNPSDGGTTSPAVGSYWYDSGQTVSIQAFPASGHAFSSWSGSGTGSYTGSTNPANAKMNGPITETANFAVLSITVSAASAPPGYGTSDGTVIVSGQGFTSGTARACVLTSTPTGLFATSPPLTCSISSSGLVTGSFAVSPTASPSSYVVRVTDTSPAGVFAETSFTVLAAPTLAASPANGPSGIAVTLSNSVAFAVQDVGACGITSSPVGLISSSACSIDSSGNLASTSFVVSANAPGGVYTIAVTGLHGDSASTLFTVTPQIALNPTSGSPPVISSAGTEVKVSGSGFKPSGVCTISAQAGLIVDATGESACSVNANGVLSAEFKVGAGSTYGVGYLVTVTGPGGDPGTGTFSVNPRIVLSPSSGSTGVSVSVRGSGFTANGGSCSLTGTPVSAGSTCSQAGDGTVTGQFSVASVTAGPYPITVNDAAGTPSASATFTVTIGPVISLSPSMGPTGTTVTVSGSGWNPADTSVTFANAGLFDGTKTCAVSGGSIASGCGFTVKSTALGSILTLTFAGTQGDSSQAQFTVQSTFVVNPNNGGAGTTDTFSGSGYTTSMADCSGDISASPPLFSSSTCAIDSNGILSGTFTVDASASPGLCTVTISGAEVQQGSISVTFTVTNPTALLSPSSGPTGTTVSVSGLGWSTADISVSFADSGLFDRAKTCAVSGGSIAPGCSFTVKSNAVGGSYSLTFTGTQGDSVQRQFLVTPRITLTPTYGPPGTTVSIAGSGFGAGDTSCALSSSPSGLLTNPSCAVSAGLVSGSFTVASGASGLYAVAVVGNTGDAATVSFTVPFVTAPWSLLNGLSPDAPGLAASSTRLFMGARSTDNTIWYRGMDSTGAWSGWVKLPGFTDARPAVVVFNSKLYIFTKEAGTNNIWYGSLPLSGGVVSGSFSGWTWLNGPSPAAVGLATDGSYLYVAAMAPDGGIWIRRMATSGVWSGWTQIPGFTGVSPAVTVFNNQLYFVCKQRSSNNMWYGYVSLVSYPGGWSGWVLLPGPTPDALTLTVSPNYLYVAARGMENGIWYRSMDSSGTWNSWGQLPGYTSSPEGICVYSGSLWFAAREAGTNNLWITNRPL